MPAEITFIRHAQTTGNAGGRWQGHTNSSLTEHGVDQAKRLAARLRNWQFNVVVSSDLDRTVATARALGYPVETDERWREPFFGSWEDLPTHEIMTRDPDNLAALLRGEDIAIGGGERLSEVMGRTTAAFRDLVARIGDGRAVVVSHGMSLLTLLSGLLGTRRPSPLRLLGNTALATIVVDGDRISLIRYNDDTHLGHTDLPHFGRSATDTEVFLIRHGRTDSTDEGRWQGHTDGRLNSTGRQQAALLGAALPPVHALYSSPLTRAVDTASAIALHQDVQVQHESALKEIGFGAWEGMTRAEIKASFPRDFAAFNNGSDVARGGNGETFAGVRKRMAIALEAIVGRHPGETVGVVSHGGSTRAYVTEVLGIGYEHRSRLTLLGNTGYARMAFTQRGPFLVSWNLAPHLDDN